MQSSQKPFDVYQLSESAVTIQFGANISENLLHQVNSFNRLLKQKPFTGFCATVPAYTTLTVFYDLLTVMETTDLPGNDGFEKVKFYLQHLNQSSERSPSADTGSITVPVCYGGSSGPDLGDVGRLLRLTTDEVIHLHTTPVYKVYMMGFVPGFAYLGGLDSRLTIPRKPTPRKAVPAGSVGLAGAQTGIYPLQTPGGWQLIGRTPLQLFNVERVQPSLLKAGDSVIFKSITEQDFMTLSRQHADTNN